MTENQPARESSLTGLRDMALTEAAVRDIRARHAAKEDRRDIASLYNITPGYVTGLAMRRSWKHVK